MWKQGSREREYWCEQYVHDHDVVSVVSFGLFPAPVFAVFVVVCVLLSFVTRVAFWVL